VSSASPGVAGSHGDVTTGAGPLPCYHKGGPHLQKITLLGTTGFLAGALLAMGGTASAHELQPGDDHGGSHSHDSAGYYTQTSPAQKARARVSVAVTLRDFSVKVSKQRVPAGRPVRFVIHNRGQAMHELVLERAGSDDRALTVNGTRYEADDIAPGATRTVTWTVPRSGKYQLACHMPGHFEMGMKTSFTATK